MSLHFLHSLRLDKLFNIFSSKQKTLAKLRAKWGAIEDKNCTQARRYFDLLHRQSQVEYVDEKTWIDLELPKIFSQMDSTETPMGSQVLYRKLRYYNKSASDLLRQYATFDVLRNNAHLRENIQLRLASLDVQSNAYIADYIFGEIPIQPKYIEWLPWWGLLCTLTLLAAITFSWSLWVWLVIFACNGLILYQLSPLYYRNIEILIGCDQMLRVADELSILSLDEPTIPELAKLADEKPLRASVKKTLGWISLLQKPLLANMTVFLNILFLAQLVAYARTCNRITQLRAKLASTFELVGALDAAIAIASYLERNPIHCQPEISDKLYLNIQNGYHPLLKAPVKNSISLHDRSALITGSNMAGKTTFIKMIGINIIFGRTLGFCLSSKAILPNSAVMSSIQNEHSVASGKSNYFVELEAIRAFITNSEQGNCRVFLIDELFNGTNTVERLAIARAVLESISNKALVLATTHDVELQMDLKFQFDQFYFQENPHIDGYFDWQIRSGIATKRNAILLLAREGYPEEIVNKATAYAINYAAKM